MNRRDFILASLAGSFMPFLSSAAYKRKWKLCYTTLGTPSWGWQEIIDKAVLYNYKGVEVRGVQDQINILDSPYFKGTAWKESKRIADDAGIEVVNLNTSAHLHEHDKVKRQKNIDEVKGYIDLAEKMDSSFVRVFPDKFPEGYTKEATVNLMKQTLQELGEYAKGSGVKVLLDAHGALVRSADIDEVLKVQNPKVTGLIWDFFNMHYQTGESPSEMMKVLKNYVSFVQLKDGYLSNKEKHDYTLMGDGEVPYKEILMLLDTMNYKGFVSFEWEKRWHPELADPDVALPAFSKLILNS